MKIFLALLLSVVASHNADVIIYEDFVPYQGKGKPHENHNLNMFDMEIPHEDKLAHRQSQEYRDFIEGPVITVFSAIAHHAFPMVAQ